MSQPSMVHSCTKKAHKTAYPSISSSQPALSAKGKTILITGGATGIGFAITTAFAAARSSNIIIVSRTPGPLAETKESIEKAYPTTKVSTFAASITDADKTSSIFADVRSRFGEPDILVLCAGSANKPATTLNIPLDNLWRDFEVNVKGNLNYVHDFLLPDTLTKEKIIINVSTAAAHLDLHGQAAYGASKAALVHLLMHIQREHMDKGVRVMNYHPGGVFTAMAQSAGYTKDAMEYDDASLSGQFALWLAFPEANFLAGRFVYANWDVEELKARADEIKNSELLKFGLIGEPAPNDRSVNEMFDFKSVDVV